MATSTSSGKLSFATTGGYVPASEDLTLEGWVYCKTTTGTGTYVYTFETGSAAFGLTIRAVTSGAGWDLHVSMTWGGGASFADVYTTTTAIPLHEWVHFVAVCPANWTNNLASVVIYINGAAYTITNNAATGTANTLNGTLTMFDRASGSRQWDGLVQRLRVWRRALSASEAAAVYACQTDADVAALSFASSLALEFKGETNQNVQEYAASYPTALADITPTVTGTVTTVDMSRYPRTLKMAALWRASDGCYSDTGMTTLITANTRVTGSPGSETGGVAALKDLTLCGNNATQSTGANKGDWYTNSASIQAVSAERANYNVTYTLATASKWDTRNTTVWMVGRWTTITEEGHSLLGDSTSAFMCQCESDGRLSGSNQSANIHGSDSLCVYVWVFSASGVTIYRNGVPATASAVGAASGLTGGNLLANGSGGEYFDGWMCEAGIYQDTQLTAAEVASLTSTLMTVYGIPTYTRKCVEDGTSSMLGSSSTYRRNRSWLLNQKTGTKNVMFFNCAFGGETLANMTSDIAVLGDLRTRELALEPSKPIKLWVQGGANEAADGAAASTALDTYLAAAIAQGYRRSDIAVQCILPSSAANLSGDQTQAGIYNNAVRAKGCFLFDSTSDSGWQWANYTSAGYYASGNAHLNDSGFSREVDGYLASRLATFLGSGGFRNRARTFGMRDR